jgi:hypothetical protein
MKSALKTHIKPFSEDNIRPNIRNIRSDTPITQQIRQGGSGAISDAEGLERAYKHGDFYLHTNPDKTKTLYVAGTNNLETIKDDLVHVPKFLGGDVKNTSRYKLIEEVFKGDNSIKHLRGHSLSGNLIQRLNQLNDRELNSIRTYSAPLQENYDENKAGKVENYCQYLDPICSFNQNAKYYLHLSSLTQPTLFHSYKSMAKTKMSDK